MIYHAESETFSVPLEEIVDIHHSSETLAGEVIHIESESGFPLKIEIAPLNQGESFVLVLTAAWSRATSDDE